ncbi:hypothetical protein [uncultured phage MedDCM-OCT-S08-C1731]|nr:hypothetical protein [uncultured phage MedDCM-OCT-S08-C1731]
MKALDGDETPEVLGKIKEREAWIARHFEDGKQFKSGDKPARPSNIAGVVAQIKWLSIGTLGERGMKDVILEAIKYLELKESGSASQAQQDRQVSSTVEKGLKNKVEEHNEKVGNVASKRTTYRTLLAVFERGIGAYKTNPASVRPNVTSPEQWAYARVNSFLFALRNGRFQGGKHDLDLLPKSHPLSSKEEKAMKDKEDRHILNVNETDDSVIIEFAKHHEDKEEEMEMTESERPYHDEDEDKDRKDDKEDRKVLEMPMKFRTIDLSKARSIDEEKRTVRIGVSSETPVERSFGMEVLGHSEDEINMEFMQSKTAPLLLDHDMKKQIGVVEEFKLDQAAKRTTAVVRFGKSALAEEVFRDVVDGIRMNISVGYRVDKLERQNKDDETYYRASWTPMEISSVSIPADASRLVGVGRSKDKQTLNTTKVKIMENENKKLILMKLGLKVLMKQERISKELKRNY